MPMPEGTVEAEAQMMLTHSGQRSLEVGCREWRGYPTRDAKRARVRAHTAWAQVRARRLFTEDDLLNAADELCGNIALQILLGDPRAAETASRIFWEGGPNGLTGDDVAHGERIGMALRIGNSTQFDCAGWPWLPNAIKSTKAIDAFQRGRLPHYPTATEMNFLIEMINEFARLCLVEAAQAARMAAMWAAKQPQATLDPRAQALVTKIAKAAGLLDDDTYAPSGQTIDVPPDYGQGTYASGAVCEPGQAVGTMTGTPPTACTAPAPSGVSYTMAAVYVGAVGLVGYVLGYVLGAKSAASGPPPPPRTYHTGEPYTQGPFLGPSRVSAHEMAERAALGSSGGTTYRAPPSEFRPGWR